MEILPRALLLLMADYQGITSSLAMSICLMIIYSLFAKLARTLLSNMKVVGGEMKQKTACISPFLHLNSLSTRAEIVPEQIGI